MTDIKCQIKWKRTQARLGVLWCYFTLNDDIYLRQCEEIPIGCLNTNNFIDDCVNVQRNEELSHNK